MNTTTLFTKTKRPLLSREFVLENRTPHILKALARNLFEIGWDKTTVATIVIEARISRAIFYECFSSKANAFEVLLKSTVENGVKEVSSIETLADFIANNKDEVHALIFCGPKNSHLYLELQDLIVKSIPMDSLKGQFVVGGVTQILRSHFRSEGSFHDLKKNIESFIETTNDL